MRSFHQLSKEERQDAIKIAKTLLINNLYEGHLELELTNEKLKSNFETQLRVARRENSVELFSQNIANHPAIQKEIDKFSIVAAHESEYDKNGYPII